MEIPKDGCNPQGVLVVVLDAAVHDEEEERGAGVQHDVPAWEG